jgi:hypothetical protein
VQNWQLRNIPTNMQDFRRPEVLFSLRKLLGLRETDASDIKQSYIHISALNIEQTDMISAINLYFP